MNRIIGVISLLLFAVVGSSGDSEWKPYAQRNILLPAMQETIEGLEAKGKGEERVNGSWRQEFKVEGSEYYRFSAEYLASQVQDEKRSILVQIDWKDKNGKRVVPPDYPSTLEEWSGRWRLVEGMLPVPDGAVQATVDLIFRWSESGEVKWRYITFEPCNTIQPREVTLATVNFRPQSRSTPENNLGLFAEFVHQAGKKGADIVCLGEGITVVSTGKKYVDVAEPIPGPTTIFLGKLAKKHEMYIVAGVYELVDETVYNTSVLLGRDGELVGTYRKVCLPREEINGGITPGSDYPVFDLDFGRVGMMICWDVFFPEVARGLAENGAEVILMPIWGGNELLFPARAVENQVYLVTSGYDAKTGIWDREGKCASLAMENGTLAITKVNLEERTLFPWLGDFKSRIFREGPESE